MLLIYRGEIWVTLKNAKGSQVEQLKKTSLKQEARIRACRILCRNGNWRRVAQKYLLKAWIGSYWLPELVSGKIYKVFQGLLPVLFFFGVKNGSCRFPADFRPEIPEVFAGATDIEEGPYSGRKFMPSRGYFACKRCGTVTGQH